MSRNTRRDEGDEGHARRIAGSQNPERVTRAQVAEQQQRALNFWNTYRDILAAHQQSDTYVSSPTTSSNGPDLSLRPPSA